MRFDSDKSAPRSLSVTNKCDNGQVRERDGAGVRRDGGGVQRGGGRESHY